MDAQSQGKEFYEIFKVPKDFYKFNPWNDIVIQVTQPVIGKSSFRDRRQKSFHFLSP